MKSSIIITSFNRSNLLKLGLGSLVKQNLSTDDVEVLVLNDGDQNDDTKNVCDSFADRLNIRYFGANHKTGWRVPSFAINFGVKQSQGKFIFISCAEIYHMDNSIELMTQALEEDNNRLVIPIQGKDDDGSFLKKLENKESIADSDYNKLGLLENIHLPFFMGMTKKNFVDIGGYDEDFVGFGYDDNDIVSRMKKAGNSYCKVGCRIVHIYHPRLAFGTPEVQVKFKINQKLYQNRKNIIVRNVGRNWGDNF